MENQCDGCKRGLPIEKGIHVDPTKTGYEYLVMVCCAKDYQPPKRPNPGGWPENTR
jgi:hypothetical protein